MKRIAASLVEWYLEVVASRLLAVWMFGSIFVTTTEFTSTITVALGLILIPLPLGALVIVGPPYALLRLLRST